MVQTDASGVGLGAVLLQGEPLKPVAYVSRKLWPRETRYSAIELECLAIKWALETFKYYLLGRDFILQTDHRGLQWLHTMKDTNNRIARWVLEMQPYRFTVQYQPGKSNVVADFLSRHPRGELPGEQSACSRLSTSHVKLFVFHLYVAVGGSSLMVHFRDGIKRQRPVVCVCVCAKGGQFGAGFCLI